MDAAFPTPVVTAAAKAAPNAAPVNKNSDVQSQEGNAFEDHLPTEGALSPSPATTPAQNAPARRTGVSPEHKQMSPVAASAGLVSMDALGAIAPAGASPAAPIGAIDVAAIDQAATSTPGGQSMLIAQTAMASSATTGAPTPAVVTGQLRATEPRAPGAVTAPLASAVVPHQSAIAIGQTEALAQPDTSDAQVPAQSAVPSAPSPIVLPQQMATAAQEKRPALPAPSLAAAKSDKSNRPMAHGASDATAAPFNAAPSSVPSALPQTTGANGPSASGSNPAGQSPATASRPNFEASLLSAKTGEPSLIFLPAGQAQAASAPLQIATPATAQPTDLVPLPDLGAAIAHRAEAGLNRFEIRLDPPELGRLDIALEFGAEGTVKAHVRADRPEALELLQREARGLEQALRQAGMTLASDGLSFSLGQGARGQSQNENGQRNTRHFKAVIEDDAKITAALNPSASASAGLDMHV